jgi:hypothetical protein
MSGPAAGTVIRPELGQGYLEIDLMSLKQGYVGFDLMPLLVVGRNAGVYPKIKLKELLPKTSLDALRRGSEGTFPRSKWEYESDNFTTEEYGLEEVVEDRASKILRDHGVAMDQIAADRSTSTLLRAIEIAVAAIVQDATTYSAQTNAVTNEWDDATNATPINDVKDAIQRFETRNGGLGPDLLQMNLKQARNVLLTDQVRSVIGYRPSEGLSQEQLQGNALMIERFQSILAMVLGVQRVKIADGFANSKLPGVTGSYSRIFSDEYVSLLRAAPSGNDLKQPGFGRIIAWPGNGGGSGQSIAVEEYYEDRVSSRVLRARVDIQLKVVHSELLEILSNITT